jgi:chemotaxis protein MotB
MKLRNALPLLLIFAALPSCQSKYTEVIDDQDRQLEAMQADRHRLLSERDRVRAENAALQERLTLEQMRAQELQDRVNSMGTQDPNVSDAELDSIRGRLGPDIGVGRRGGNIFLDLPQGITFGSGKAELSRTGKKSMAAVVDLLRTDYADKTFWVEGHTDNDPISKSGWKSNLHLSVMRALAVAEYLSKDLGIDPSQVRVAGYGEFAPKIDNDNTENKASNRRVEILILD